jgi:Phage integrase, N-terminal SAM-like domain
VSGRTKTEAKTKLREAQRARDDGLPAGRRDYTVRQAVESWLEHGPAGRDPSTVRNRTILARRHVLPALGSRRLAELTADEVDRWLTGESKGVVSTDTLARLLSILRQSIRRAQARDLVQRNVALLCEAPKGTVGRPSKSLSLEQAGQLLMAAEGTSMHAYVVVSLLTGARTEERGRSPGVTWIWRMMRAVCRRRRRAFSCGGPCGQVVRQRRSHPAEPWSCRRSASTRSANTDNASLPTGFGWGSGGLTSKSSGHRPSCIGMDQLKVQSAKLTVPPIVLLLFSAHLSDRRMSGASFCCDQVEVRSRN